MAVISYNQYSFNELGQDKNEWENKCGGLIHQYPPSCLPYD